MGRIVAIDLGMTYSAVAIPEERTGEGFVVVPGCPGCSVILDTLKRPITPSVVAEDSRGQIVVGYAAKRRVGLSPRPIMFAKRAMGDDRTFQLARRGALRPEEVAACVLRYLKRVAEERLGEPVDEAVITVPAYFSLRAKQMTAKAGELAGLKVVQVALEPVAAALMSCAGDLRESLRIMTYDLGGGTFDVAILERRGGTISTDSIIAFDGDQFLGGYTFDQKLARWIMDQLVTRGYDLTLNLDDPADAAIFARLTIYAEQAKIHMSNAEAYTIEDVTSGIVDHTGNTVAIEDLTITRAVFEAMITPEIEETMALCHRARTEKAARLIEKEQFDEILMVGGSSYIPLVARRLSEEFGRVPKLIEPNLCVALGAAILAGTKSRSLHRPGHPAVGPEPMLALTHILARPLGIVTADGVHVLAQAGTRLPYESGMSIKTSDTSEIRVPIMEGHRQLGEIVMADIPSTLAVGSAIEVTLTIQANEIRARAYVPAIAREAEVVIDISMPPPQKTMDQLREEYDVLSAEAKDALDMARRSAWFGDVKARRLTDRLTAAAELLQSPGSEPAMIQDRLDEVRSLVRANRAGAGWWPEPPRAVFEQKANEVGELLARAIAATPTVAEDGYVDQLAAIRSEAEKAYTNQNTTSWKDTFTRVVALCQRLEAVITRTAGSDDAHPAALRLALARELERTAQDEGSAEFRADFDMLARDLQAIDPRAPTAMTQMRHWYLTKLAGLRHRLNPATMPGLSQVDGDYGHSRTSSPRDRTGFHWRFPTADLPVDRRSEGDPRRAGTPQVPHGAVDRVTFSVTAPVGVLPGASFSLDVWAHLKTQRRAVIRQAREAAAGGEILVKSKGPVQLARGTVLFVRLELDGLHVENPDDTIRWDGDIGNATFSASVPREAAHGPRKGLARIYVDALEIARVDFTLYVSRVAAGVDEISTSQLRHRSAFASYASADRSVVLLLVQGIEKAGVDVFLDVLSLRSGQRWEEELRRRIPRSDVFYLFWSENARRSDWVEKEWRCALETRGLDFIDPVPLAPPDEVPPPPELASRHFNDWALAFRRGMGRQPPPV